MPTNLFLLFAVCFLFPFSTSVVQNVYHPDFKPLMEFMSTSDPLNKLLWNDSTDICDWQGVECSWNRVSHLNLVGCKLNGSINSLAALQKLTSIVLNRNEFGGSIPDLSSINSLHVLFLSMNDFTGNFPQWIGRTRIWKIDFSYNRLSGEIPLNLNAAVDVHYLFVQHNQFFGGIFFLDLPQLRNLNLSSNNLTGEIPISLSYFSVQSFINTSLCGVPLPKCNASMPALPPPISQSPQPPFSSGPKSPTPTSSSQTPPPPLLSGPKSLAPTSSSHLFIAVGITSLVAILLTLIGVPYAVTLFVLVWRGINMQPIGGLGSGVDDTRGSGSGVGPEEVEITVQVPPAEDPEIADERNSFSVTSEAGFTGDDPNRYMELRSGTVVPKRGFCFG